MRQPALPAVAVAKAVRDREFYHNVSIQEIYGVPEFRWFDGGQVLTTFPTREQILKSFTADLERADMLAPSRIDSEYMLYVQFEDIHALDRWVGSDKLAAAKITFRLVRWRTNEVVKVVKFNADYRAKWAGVTPDEARAALVGPIGVTRDSAFAPVAGLVGGLAVGTFDSEYRIAHGLGHLTDLQAASVGGFVGPVFEVTLPGVVQTPVLRPVASNEELGTGVFNGTRRRWAATQGLLNLAFDELMLDLSHDGATVYKKAVSCASLNPTGYQVAFLKETDDAYAIDCPGAEFNQSKTRRAYPNDF